MQESAVVENLIRQIVDEARRRNAAKVTRVQLALGEVLGFDAEALKAEYARLTGGTVAEGSLLDIHWLIAGRDMYIER